MRGLFISALRRIFSRKGAKAQRRKDAKTQRFRADGEAPLKSPRSPQPNVRDSKAASPQELPLCAFAPLRESPFSFLPVSCKGGCGGYSRNRLFAFPEPPMRLPVLAAALYAATLSVPSAAQDSMTAPQYPETRRGDTAETLFGETIADPYRWLENDVRNDPEVAAWVERQNAVTDAYLARLPARAWFKRRIGELYDYERFSVPVKRGNRYFYTRNSGLQNQSPLYVREGLTGAQRLLIDPNAWAADAATALSDWRASPDGSKVLYSVQDGGTDWRIVRVLDVATGQDLSDEVRWAKFTDLAWVGEEGFLYSRFPEPAQGQDFQALNYDQAVHYHRLGTPQSADEPV